MAKKTTKAAKPKAKTAPKPKARSASGAKQATGAASNAARSAAERVAEPIKQAGQRVRDGAGRAVKNTVAVNTKVIDHAETNAREAFAAMRKVASAQSLQDVIKVQSEFVRQQGARTATQVREVGEMIASFGRDALEMMRGR